MDSCNTNQAHLLESEAYGLIARKTINYIFAIFAITPYG